MKTESTARRQIMVFAMGAMVLITLATTIIVGAHYWEMLSGIFLIAIVGLTLPDWAAWWATYWHARATKKGQEDTRVSVTCLVVSAVMSVVMILNAGAVMAVWWNDKKSVETAERNSKAVVDFQNSQNVGNTDAIKARGQVVNQMKVAGATQRTIREYIKAETDRDKTKSLTGGGTVSEGPKVEEFKSSVPEGVRKYMSFWVYIVPFLAGLFGVFAIVVAVALPGGVEFKKSEETRQAPGFASSLPAPVSAASRPNVNGNFYNPSDPK